MKYKYQFKNKDLGNALGVIFGEEYVENCVNEQMKNEKDYIYIEIDESEGITSDITFNNYNNDVLAFRPLNVEPPAPEDLCE